MPSFVGLPLCAFDRWIQNQLHLIYNISVCVDDDGITHALFDRWKPDVCTDCECVPGGVSACLTPACAGKPREDCVAEETTEPVCCVNWICPPGKKLRTP